MSHKLPKVAGFKRFMHLASCLGASIVIVGALFKIMHWPGASIALIGGLGTEAFLFALFAYDIPHEEVDWTLAYPILGGMGHAEDKPQSVEDLGQKFHKAGIDDNLIEDLSAGMKTLSSNASKIADMSEAHNATNGYVKSLNDASGNVNKLSESYSKAANTLLSLSIDSETSKNLGTQIDMASKNLSALNATYELQLKNSKDFLASTGKFYQDIASLVENLHGSVNDTKKYREEMSNLTANLTALNNIYGNMLSAMNFNKGVSGK